MRLFISINFTNIVKSSLVDVQKKLRESAVSGRFSHPEHMHLTIVFLGEIPGNRVRAVTDAMDKAKSPPFTISMYGMGNFGDTVWIGFRRSSNLSDLYKQLAVGLRDSGFTVESRPFKPHLTLGRQVILKPGVIISDLGVFPEITADVQAIHLMKSEHIQSNLIHTAIHEKILHQNS